MSGTLGEGKGVGYAIGNLKNMTTGQRCGFFIFSGGVMLAAEAPFPSASLDGSSWAEFTTIEPMTFNDFQGRSTVLKDFNYGLVIGRSEATLHIEGMKEEYVDVSGVVTPQLGVSASEMYGVIVLEHPPQGEMVTEETTTTEEDIMMVDVPNTFAHTVFFDTGSAQITGDNQVSLVNHADYIVRYIEAFKKFEAEK